PLQAQPSLAAEGPVDADIGAGEAGDVLADMLLDGWRPGHELEAQPVFDHGVAAGGQREALAIGAGDILAGGGLLERHVHFSGELLAECVQLALPKRAEQVAGEDDPLALAPRQSFLDQVLGAGLHRLLYLKAEAAAEIDGIAGDELAVEP